MGRYVNQSQFRSATLPYLENSVVSKRNTFRRTVGVNAETSNRMESGKDLAVLNGLTVDNIYQIDWHNDRGSWENLPLIFFFTFEQFDKYLRLEGDIDGDNHIKIELKSIDQLERDKQECNFPDDPELWKIYETEATELLGGLLKKTIQFYGYGVDKEKYDSSYGKIGGDLFTFIRFNLDNECYTISDSMGLKVSDDPNVKLYFEETFDRFDTKNESTNANNR